MDSEPGYDDGEDDQEPGAAAADAIRVHLVGAGPGDPGLLTVRGRSVLRACDCVLYDYLVNPRILAEVPAAAERHDVGKRGGLASISQDAINHLLVTLAQRHRRVVRLKGGDPFLFGRGGEEAAALAAAGIRFAVVPGVTAGIGVPAYAGIPVTHRAASSVVAFAAGHQAQGADGEIDWAALAAIETVVLYMGMHRLGEHCQRLIAHGRAPSTPACAIQWGTYRARQRVVTGTLATLPGLAAAAGLGAPAITVIGEVVRYRERIAWFDQGPLVGRRLLVTRASDQAGSLADALSELGAEVVVVPTARFAPLSIGPARADLDAALAAIPQTPWTVFTSANGVRQAWQRLRELGLDARHLHGTRLAAVGPATARALQAIGLGSDLQPETASGQGLAQALAAWGNMHPDGRRALLLQADNAAGALHQGLVAAGWTVRIAAVYQAVPVDTPLPEDLEQLAGGTFASAASVDRFLALLPAARREALRCGPARWFAIGPQTAAALVRHGFAVAGVAGEPTVAALATLVAASLGPLPSPGID